MNAGADIVEGYGEHETQFLRKQPCLQVQVNRRVDDFYCNKDAGHNAGHVDPATGKVWGTPRRPYGMRGAKAARKRKTK